ncbi:MAG: glycosyltransferase family 2 protein [Methanobrevibacter sp.]|jgi:glycosyltransferase involved in cell wall biosynthesis|nr:glycosyltransferase family 2 protein [Methanobrevibacter sp.]
MDNRDFKISVIIPVYNSEMSLKKSLDSIVNQTMGLNDIEVLMVNDGSTDRSKEIINKYSEMYLNFKAIHREVNSDCAGIPRNIGLDNATGKYIIFLDSDDIYHMNSFELLYDAIEDNEDVDYVRGRFLIDFLGYDFKFNVPTFYRSKIISSCISGNPKTGSKITNLFLKHALDKIITTLQDKNDLKYVKFHIKDHKIKLTMLSIVSGIFKRRIIEEYNIRFNEWKTGEDYVFTLEYLIKSGKLLILIDEIVYTYMKDVYNKNSLFILSNIVYLPIPFFHYKKLCDDGKMKTNILKVLVLWLFLYLKEDLSTETCDKLKKAMNKLKKSSNTKFDRAILGFVGYGMKLKR